MGLSMKFGVGDSLPVSGSGRVGWLSKCGERSRKGVESVHRCSSTSRLGMEVCPVVPPSLLNIIFHVLLIFVGVEQRCHN